MLSRCGNLKSGLDLFCLFVLSCSRMERGGDEPNVDHACIICYVTDKNTDLTGTVQEAETNLTVTKIIENSRRINNKKT